MDFIRISVRRCCCCWHPMVHIHTLIIYFESLSISHRFRRCLSPPIYDHILPSLESKQTLQSNHVPRWCHSRWGYDQRHPSENVGNRRLGAVSYILHSSVFFETFPASYSLGQVVHVTHGKAEVTAKKKAQKLCRARRPSLSCEMFCERKAEDIADPFFALEYKSYWEHI